MCKAVIFLFFIIITTFQYRGFSQDQHEYKKWENRYEGRKAVGVSAPDLELLSFVAYREEVKPNNSVVLKVKFYMPTDTIMYITAKEFIPREFYLMKSDTISWKQGWQTFAPWPTDDVINPIKLKFEQLGIVGRLFNDNLGSGFIVPLVVYHTKHSSKVSEYTIHLRPKETLTKVSFQLYKAGSEEPLQEDNLRKTFFSQEPFIISLNMEKQPSGVYQLFIRCRVKNRIDGPKRSYQFYHNPIVPIE